MRSSSRDKRDTAKAIWKKTRRQTLKDYVAFPLLAGPFAPFVFTGNLTANLMRNVWSYMIIFCGHFPDGTQEFTVEETKDESRGQWYFRQVLGSANLTGGKIFHLLSGNLSHQIEHHLFPDMPARRYPKIAPEVQEICERYGIPYNKGPLLRQFGTVVRKIVELTFPDSVRRSRRRAADRAGGCLRLRPMGSRLRPGRVNPLGSPGRSLEPGRGTMGPVEWTGARYSDNPTVEAATWIDADPAAGLESGLRHRADADLQQRAAVCGVARRSRRAPDRGPVRRTQRTRRVRAMEHHVACRRLR